VLLTQRWIGFNNGVVSCGLNLSQLYDVVKSAREALAAFGEMFGMPLCGRGKRRRGTENEGES
jgi:hypothetical protein